MICRVIFKGLAACILLSISFQCLANNLTITDAEVHSRQQLSFTVQWENSWNLEGIQAPFNHDAAWIFVKFREDDGNEWQHLAINAADSAHALSDTQMLAINPVSDEKGLFLKRKAEGSVPITPTEVTISFANVLPPGNYDFRIFGIEMVYVPKGPFHAGDGVSNNTLVDAGDDSPYLIDSNAMIPVGNNSGHLNSKSDYPPASNVPAKYPEGFDGFYAMKYEISQQQYVDFLNTLTANQQANRVHADPKSQSGKLAFNQGRQYRNGIVIEQPAQGNQPARFSCNVDKSNSFGNNNDGQWRACNFLKWADLAAFLDWSGLRPMTELEFEKLARGPEQPVKREFAWGTNKVTDANTLKHDGTKRETSVDTPSSNAGLASHGYAGPQGPLRNGFGGSDTSNRLSIGSGYYGALELSGNLWEIAVVLNDKGLQFKGDHGDGLLNEAGFANTGNWPGKNGNGAGFRGGGWNSGILIEFRDLAISDRFYVFDAPGNRRETTGGRGVRSYNNK